MSDLRIRDAVRAVVLDPDDRVLLVRFEFAHWSGWATPGGGVARGETDEVAIRRELAEETGLEAFELGPLVWTRTHLFELDEWDGQVERCYLVHGGPRARAEAVLGAAEPGVRHGASLVDARRAGGGG